MKKRILLTALLLPSLMFTSPVNAADIVSGETYSGFSGGTGSVMYLAGTGSEVKSAINNVFKNNTATSWGGAAYVTNAKLEIDGSTFTNNTASWAGAIAGGTNNSNLVINNSVFENNSALAIGAVGVFKNATITKTQFVGNKATDATDDGAGALFVGSEGAIAKLDNVIFQNNTSANSGGAIGTRVAENANGTKNDNSAAVLNITNSTFEGNTAATTGGAIDNHFYSAASGIATSTFKNNSAASGGAIYNHGDKDFKGNAANLKVMDTVFVGNSATKSGGAIYSAADMQLTNVEFEGNNAGSWGGAAYVTNGTLTIENGTFANNTASWAGAIASGINNSNLVINNSVFENNSALAIGAVGVFKNATITNTQFVGNKATDAADDGAGALFVGSEGAIAKLDNVIFQNNTSANSGGAIGTRVAENANGTKNDNSAAVLNITNSTFEGNTAAITGGAIDNHFYSAASGIATSTFKNNSAASGGAIYNHGDKDFKGNAANLKVMDTVFVGNSATKSGGAIYSAADAQLTNVEFDGNNAGSWGGAAYVTNGTLTIENGTFANNTASWAGAIASGTNNSNLVINNSVFENNSALAIGAVGVFKNATITNSQFVGNKATDAADDGAGALFLGASSHTVVENSVFENNYSASRGGAIATRDINQGNNIDGKLDISNSTFINNEAAGDGGAIYNAFSSNNYPQNISLVGVTFDGNKAGGNGGAIYNAAADLGGNVSSVYITDSSFTNNSAAGLGGAIYSHGTVNIEAKDANVVFANNTSSTGSNDIYMAAAGSNLNIKVADGKTVTFESGIAGNNFNLNINTVPMARFAMLRAAAPVEYNGSVVIKSAIENATVNVNSGELHLAEGSSIVASTVNMADGTTLNTINGAIDDYGSSINVGNDVTLAVDVYMADGSADKIDDIANASTVTIEEINPIGNTTENNINFNIAEALGINPSKMTISDALQQETQKVLTPIRYLTGSVDAQGNATFVPTGNGYKDFNPGVMASSVAAQLGGLFNQYNSYNQAFMNMDMRMQMNSQERQALRLKNSIASTDTTAPMVYSPIFQPDKNKGGWMRGYSTFESVNMDGGPKVNNVMYGTFFGGDSDMQQLANGGEVQYSVYAGYNGSHQTYSGNSMWQNGGTMGVTGAYYKDNFFTALTANVGASVVDATTLLGKEDFSMLAAGIASKTGYNIEFADGKFIIQPNYLMSYSFVNTFDYTNAAGVRIDSDPLNAIQIAPGVKFIGNLKNGWQPYASVRMVWNLMDKTDFTAANTSLPELSIKPWVEYGVGVQKRWGERFTGFAQTMLRSGGRNGVSLGLGFRWAIGKAPEKNPNARNFTPELPKAKITMSR